jgi:hypothetical protein
VHRVLVLPALLQVRGVVVPEFFLLFLRKILLLVCVEMFLHLPDNVLGLVVVLDLEVFWRPGHFIRVPAGRTKFPALEIVHVRECHALRAADDKVHNQMVMYATIIYTYRHTAWHDPLNALAGCRGRQIVSPMHSETLISAVHLIEM